MSEIYEPREDSYLLRKHIKRYAKGLTLDMGTGSGVLALEASKKAKKVIALDINKKAIESCKKNIKEKNIEFHHSDLFKYLTKKRKKIDLIIFNPPYLPEEKGDKDIALYGGKHGYETIERFINNLNKHLDDKGKTLLLFSSFTKKEKVDEFIKNNLFSFKLIDKEHIFFEDLFVYLIEKDPLLIRLNNLGIKNITYFVSGKRGMLFTGIYKGKKVVIKAKNPRSKAVGRIKNEIEYLKLLNKHSIGPKLHYHEDDFFMYPYIDGKFIEEFVRTSKRKDIVAVLDNVFKQLLILDDLGLDKKEMTRPVKHIIVSNDKKPYLIDFERSTRVKNPKNVTQFMIFLVRKTFNALLKEKGIDLKKEDIIRLSKEYKKSYDKKIVEGLFKDV